MSAIDAAFRVYRANFVVLYLAALAAAVPVLALLAAVAGITGHLLGGDVDVERVAAGLPFAAFVTLPALAAASVALAAIAGVFGLGAAAGLVHGLLLDGSVSLRRSLAAGARGAPRLLVVTLVSGGAAVAGGLCLVVPGLVALTGFAFAGLAVVLDGARPTAALARSWHLSRGRRAALASALALLVMLAASVSAGVAAFVAGLAWMGEGDAAQLVRATAWVAGSVVTVPLFHLTVVLLYLTARAEREGLDIEVLARSTLPPGPGKP